MAEQNVALVPANTDADYTQSQVDLIKRTVAAGTTDDEFQLFLAICQGTGLNPILRQIYAIKRESREKGDDDQWRSVAKMTVQTGIDGYRVIAHRTGDFAGVDEPIYDREDASHPNWAKVTVYRFNRAQRVAYTAKVRWTEFAVLKDGNPTGLWAKMPYHMLGKVAESHALRKAFQAETRGIYTTEEMMQADNDYNPTTVIVEERPPSAPRATQAQSGPARTAPPANNDANDLVAPTTQAYKDVTDWAERFGVKMGIIQKWMEAKKYNDWKQALTVLNQNSQEAINVWAASHDIKSTTICEYQRRKSLSQIALWDLMVTKPSETQAAMVAIQQAPVPQETPPAAVADAMASERQITSIQKLSASLNRPEPNISTLTFVQAKELLAQLSQAYSEARQAS